MARRTDVETRLTAVDKTKAAFNRVAKRMKSLKKASLVAGGGVAAIAAGLTVAAKRAVNFGDHIAKTAKQLNISTDALQEMRLAADLAGISTSQLEKGLGGMGKRLGELKKDQGTLFTFFRDDNQFRKQLLQTKTIDGAFRLIIKRMDTMDDQQKKLALSGNAFGRGVGQALAGMNFKQFEEGIRLAREFGIAIDKNLLREAEDLKDAFTIAASVFQKQFFTVMLKAMQKTDLKQFATDMALIAGAAVRAALGIARFFGIIAQEKLTPLEEAELRLANIENKLEAVGMLHGGNAEQIKKVTAAHKEQLAVLKKKIELLKNPPPPKDKKTERLGVGIGRTPLREQFPQPATEAQTKKFARLTQQLNAYRDGVLASKQSLEQLTGQTFKNIQALDNEAQRLETTRGVRETLNKMRKQGLGISKATEDALVREANAVDALNRKLENKRELLEPTPIQQYMKDIKSVEIQLQEAAINGADALTSSLIGLMNQTQSTKEAFRSFALSIIQNLQKIMIKKLLVDKIMGWAQTAMPSVFGKDAPKKAAGGPVSAGRPYIVGERGPELMVPNRSGSIVPNDKLGGGPSIVNNYDFSGANPATIMALRQEADRIKQDTFASVFGAIDRGGSYARVSGRR